MNKISKSFKSYILRKKMIEEEKLKAEMKRKAQNALATPEIFVSDRSDTAANFHVTRRLK